jgi:enoyl-CoA hydratase
MLEEQMHGSVAVVRMAHGKANALGMDLLGAIADRFERRDDGCAALVLTGTGPVFSAGADLRAVLSGDAGDIARGLDALSRAFRAVFAYPRPVVAAINGHAIAGGAILAAACDHRVMADDGSTIGVAELRVGVPYPAAALEILRFAVRQRGLQELVYFGENYLPPEALARGLTDELIAPDSLMPRALEAAERLARIPARSFEHTKRALHQPTLDAIDARAPADDAAAAEIWASDQVKTAISNFLQALRG